MILLIELDNDENDALITNTNNLILSSFGLFLSSFGSFLFEFNYDACTCSKRLRPFTHKGELLEIMFIYL